MSRICDNALNRLPRVKWRFLHFISVDNLSPIVENKYTWRGKISDVHGISILNKHIILSYNTINELARFHTKNKGVNSIISVEQQTTQKKKIRKNQITWSWEFLDCFIHSCVLSGKAEYISCFLWTQMNSSNIRVVYGLN